MNRLIQMVVGALGVLFLVAVNAQAGSTNTVTNAVGQVIVVVTDNYGVHISSVTPANLPASQSRVYIPAQGNYRYDGAHSTTNYIYTPRDIGDILIGSQLGTGAVWMATGVTTGGWQKLTYP